MKWFRRDRARTAVTAFTAIVTPPQVAILATARTIERAVVRDGAVTTRRIMTATLSSDHRVVDGVGAARFLGTLKGLLEAPVDWAVVA
ncbi:MAG: 2-oxo acid dehydrogenase subunit E2 [Candidatus Limnocylindrales bacterium]